MKRHVTTTYFWKKNKDGMFTCKINEFKRISRNEYIRNMYSCTHGFQKVKEHRTNFVTEEKAAVLDDSHSRHPISVKH